ncbi:MAG: hypothetical protein ABI689_05365 [Thermoanaerobaculia bacterium]
MVDESAELGSGTFDGPLSTLRAVATALETAGARYFVGGSLASSLQGIPRSTQDVDLVADLAAQSVEVFVRALGAGFYADSERIRDGIARLASFNVIDLRNGFKADIYLAVDDAFGRAQLERSQRVEVEPGLTLPFASAEDVVLQKLRWYHLGGGVSERQWLDALGVLKVQGARLDRAYLERWASALDLADLLARLREDAGSEGSKV